jgi:flagellar protein FliO/FliZ
MIKASLLPRTAALAAAVTLTIADPARAAGAALASGEKTPLHLDTGVGTTTSHVGSSGGSIVRTVVGLALVIGVIYGLTWVLRQVKGSKEEKQLGSALASVATLPLGPNRSLHLIRAGEELVLLGVAEHGVTPIRTYAEDEARAAGLLDIQAPAAKAPARTLQLTAARTTATDVLASLRAMTVRR